MKSENPTGTKRANRDGNCTKEIGNKKKPKLYKPKEKRARKARRWWRGDAKTLNRWKGKATKRCQRKVKEEGRISERLNRWTKGYRERREKRDREEEGRYHEGEGERGTKAVIGEDIRYTRRFDFLII